MKSDIVGKIMDYEGGSMDEEQIVEFFQELIDTEIIHDLQGSYQRMAKALIEAGYCHFKVR